MIRSEENPERKFWLNFLKLHFLLSLLLCDDGRKKKGQYFSSLQTSDIVKDTGITFRNISKHLEIGWFVHVTIEFSGCWTHFVLLKYVLQLIFSLNPLLFLHLPAVVEFAAPSRNRPHSARAFCGASVLVSVLCGAGLLVIFLQDVFEMSDLFSELCSSCDTLKCSSPL